MRRRFALVSRLRALLGADAAGVRQSLVALFLNSSTSFVAGAFLGSVTATLAKYPGLLVLVPAAIGLRGNVFGAFGNRISTTIHAGTFRLTARRDTVLGQNIQAALFLTVGLSVVLALAAKAAAVGLGVEESIGILDLSLISVVGGLLGSLVVLVATLGLSAGAVRYGWDLDNVAAPLVSSLGDVLTLPALVIATGLVGIHLLTPSLAVAVSIVGVAAVVYGLRTRYDELRRITRESLPVLVIAGCVSLGAGIALEKSFHRFDLFPALLVLVPAHLSSGGALGGILAGRLSTKMLLGTAEPASTPSRESRRDIGLLFLVAVPVLVFNGAGAQLVSELIGSASPGWADMMAVSLIAGLAAMALVMLIAYYATVVAIRTGVDPDTYGIPVVSSFVDFVGALTLIITISVLGIT